MPFVLPKRVARAGDLMKKEDFNADWQPVAELASGGLDSHNIKSSSLATSAVIADGAFHKNYYVEQAVDSGWGSAAGYTVPTLAALPANAWVVPITSNWSRVGGMSISSIVTGTSNLWIVGWCSYVYYGFGNVANNRGAHTAVGTVYSDAGLQLAIRVDGQILPETITGHTEDHYRPYQPLKPERQRDSSDAVATSRSIPGPGLFQSHIIRGHGPQAGALRLVANAPVGPGNHTVELVARIVQKNNPLASFVVLTTNGVGIHSRKLFVLDCPIVPVAAPTRTPIEVPALDDASAVSAASFSTARHAVVTAGLNDLNEGNLARGALTGRHLPDVPLDVSYTWIRPTGPIEYNCKYPGYGVDTIVARTPNLTGWAWVLDTTGPKLLRTDADLDRPAGDFLTNLTDCIIVVMADVQLHEIDGGANSEAGTQTSSVACFGAFALAIKDNGGTDNVVASTEAYFNNHLGETYAAGFPASRPIEINVPLFHVFNYSPNTGGTAGVLQGSDTDYIGVVTSAFRTSVTGGGTITLVPDVYCQRGNLTVLMLRG